MKIVAIFAFGAASDMDTLGTRLNRRYIQRTSPSSEKEAAVVVVTAVCFRVAGIGNNIDPRLRLLFDIIGIIFVAA